jgi:hypothetical protein
MITQKRLKEVVTYDPETGKFCWKQTRSGRRSGIFGSIDANGYGRVCIDGKRYLLHRLAFLYMTGKFPENHVDHVDRVKLNNAWVNLRNAVPVENNRNVGMRVVNTSGATGVWWEKDRCKFRVGIKAGGRTIYGSRHNDFESAIQQRNEMVVKYHADFGVLS